jgi:hypothetical protein
MYFSTAKPVVGESFHNRRIELEQLYFHSTFQRMNLQR